MIEEEEQEIDPVEVHNVKTNDNKKVHHLALVSLFDKVITTMNSR